MQKIYKSIESRIRLWVFEEERRILSSLKTPQKNVQTARVMKAA
ncbi:MAG TPA: hypothetical protein VL688_12785 [Verrucomicrobiae bacterium]|nr:hypothetical protein [Verrucomicrobiae bacterium]